MQPNKRSQQFNWFSLNAWCQLDFFALAIGFKACNWKKKNSGISTRICNCFVLLLAFYYVLFRFFTYIRGDGFGVRFFNHLSQKREKKTLETMAIVDGWIWHLRAHFNYIFKCIVYAIAQNKTLFHIHQMFVANFHEGLLLVLDYKFIRRDFYRLHRIKYAKKNPEYQTKIKNIGRRRFFFLLCFSCATLSRQCSGWQFDDCKSLPPIIFNRTLNQMTNRNKKKSQTSNNIKSFLNVRTFEGTFNI